MHFGKLKLLPPAAFSQLECAKFVFGRSSAPDPARGAYSAPADPLADLKGLTSKGKGGEERREKGEGREKEGRGGERDGKERE